MKQQTSSAFRWEDVFQLPETAYACNKRIPKTVLSKQALLTKHEMRTLDKVRRLEHFATVQKTTTRILPIVDENRDIQSVVFLHSEMAGSQAFSEVAKLIHNCFPNPTVILSEGASTVCVSVAITRKSQSEQGATVIERIENTGAFKPSDDLYAPFLNKLSFSKLPQGNLLDYLEGIATNIKLSKATNVLGYFPTCDKTNQEELFKVLASYETTSRKIKEFETQRRTDRNLTLNESSKLRIDQRQLERKAAQLAEQIKEICNE